MLKCSCIILLIAFLGISPIFGQKTLTTHSGQRILIVDDGSWRILGASENNEANNSESGTSLESFKSPKQGKYPINLDQQEKIHVLLTSLLSDEAQLLVNIEMDKRKLDQLNLDKKSTDTKEDRNLLKYKIDQTKNEIKTIEKDYKSTSKFISLANKLLEGKVKNAEKSIATLINRNESDANASGMGGTKIEEIEEVLVDAPLATENKKGYTTMFGLDTKREKRIDSDCEIVFDGYDKDIGEDRKEVKKQHFFSFSQEKMKPYFKTEDYLNCEASISKVGKKYYLTLNIKIRSKDATKTYGMLQSNQNIKLEMIDGTSIYGRLINNDNGKIESYTGNTLYQGIIEIQKGDINQLKNKYLDNLGIIWSSGYEQYDIYNVDFLVNQLECLNN